METILVTFIDNGHIIAETLKLPIREIKPEDKRASGQQTGSPIFPAGEPNVRIGIFLSDLSKRGYSLVDAYAQPILRKKNGTITGDRIGTQTRFVFQNLSISSEPSQRLYRRLLEAVTILNMNGTLLFIWANPTNHSLVLARLAISDPRWEMHYPPRSLRYDSDKGYHIV